MRRLLTLLLAVIVVGVAWGWLAWTGRQTAEVPTPADDAAPADVVRAYVAALDARDCDTAKALKKGSTWCGDVARLDSVEIATPTKEPAGSSGLPAGTEVMRVPVVFTVHWRPLHGDGSVEEGAIRWGYLLERATPADPWRIFDEGLG